MRIKKLTMAWVAVGVMLLAACSATQQRKVYNSLATTGIAEETSYEAFLTLVLNGSVKTNDVPVVSQRHRDFKALFDAACTSAQLLTNITETPPEVVAAAGSVNTAIAAAKAK